MLIRPGDVGVIDNDIWSIVCFFVARSARGTGLFQDLLDTAIDHADHRGAAVIGAHPVDQDSPSCPFRGFVPNFEAARFNEVARAGSRLQVMTLHVADRRLNDSALAASNRSDTARYCVAVTRARTGDVERQRRGLQLALCCCSAGRRGTRNCRAQSVRAGARESAKPPLHVEAELYLITRLWV